MNEGTQYTSRKFSDFEKYWDFKTTTSFARYLQSNGMVEGHIQTVKRILKKAKFENKDPFRFLLECRYLLTFNMNYENTEDNNYETGTNCGADKSHKKKYFSRKTKALSDFSVDYKFRIQNEKNKVFGKSGISCNILTKSERIVNPHKKHIMRDSNNSKFKIVKQEINENTLSIGDNSVRSELDTKIGSKKKM